MTGPCNGNDEKLIFTCGGTLHCGQVAMRVGELLRNDGIGQIMCLAAIAGHVPDKLERARRAPMRIAIDGCEDQCARRTLELAGLPADVHVVLTNLGIEKAPAHPNLLDDATKAIERLRFAVTG